MSGSLGKWERKEFEKEIAVLRGSIALWFSTTANAPDKARQFRVACTGEVIHERKAEYIKMKPGKRRDIRGTFGLGRGVYITNALRDSVAYQTLSPVERLVLIDMVRAYNAASSGDKNPLVGIGFRFTYGDCRELVDSKSFLGARKSICKHGFFREAIELKSIAVGAPSIYLPSTEWVKYKPSDAEVKRLELRRERKKKTLKRGYERKKQFIHSKGQQ